MKKESLQNVEVKKTPAGGLKDKLLRRKLTKTSSIAAPSEALLENKDSEKPSNELEKDSLKAKLARRKSKKASDSAPPDSPLREEKFEGVNVESTSLVDTPTSVGGGGLKAKLQRRKNKQAMELANQENQPDVKQSEDQEQEEY